METLTERVCGIELVTMRRPFGRTVLSYTAGLSGREGVWINSTLRVGWYSPLVRLPHGAREGLNQEQLHARAPAERDPRHRLHAYRGRSVLHLHARRHGRRGDQGRAAGRGG